MTAFGTYYYPIAFLEPFGCGIKKFPCPAPRRPGLGSPSFRSHLGVWAEAQIYFPLPARLGPGGTHTVLQVRCSRAQATSERERERNSTEREKVSRGGAASSDGDVGTRSRISQL